MSPTEVTSPTAAPAAARRRAAWLLLGAAVLGAAAALLAATVLVDDRAVVVSANVTVNPPGPIDANNSPSVARDPTDPDRVVVAHRVDRPGFSALLHRSEDGGRTWATTDLPLPPGRDRPFAPDAAFAPDGTLYVLYANLFGAGNVPENLWLSTSDDGGRTLTPPRPVTGRFAFQGQLAVAPDGTLHVTWLAATELGLLKLAAPAPLVTASSRDGGRTWTAPVRISDRDRVRVGAATPVALDGGRLLVVYEDFGDDRRDFENLQGPAHDGTFSLVATWSDDGGATWTPGLEFETGIQPLQRFLVFLPEFPSVVAGPGGAVHVAWADGRAGTDDVYLRSSADRGETWADRVLVTDADAATETTQDLPAIDVAPDGRLDIVYYDRGRDPRDERADAVLATSEDGGASFEHIRLSSSSFDATVGSSAAPHLPVDYGTRLGVSSTADAVFAAWTDSRFGSAASGRQDVIAARVSFPDPGGMAVRGVVAAALASAALAALLVWRRNR